MLERPRLKFVHPGFPELCRAFALLVLLTLWAAPSTLAAEPDAENSEETAQNGASSEDAQDGDWFERVKVVGSVEKARTVPGSATYLDRERLQRHHYTDIHRVLSQIAGLNLQEEEGYGLRPNIGIRGSGAERSSKITLMEDGVLIAPAPYSAPSAYYFPSTGRMEGIEVRKGSSSIRQGPFTTGGVVNMLSSGIPSQFGGSARFALGEDDTTNGRLVMGDSGERYGWLAETLQVETDGFKQIDGGGDTGFELEDYLVKGRLQSSPDARMFQALELKLGKTEQDGQETYLGLTQADFDANPFRRYAASQEDGIITDHEQAHLRYVIRPNERFDLTATVYRNEFFRNWRKLERVNGTSVSAVLDDPGTFASELDILRGDLAADSADDALSVRNNRRDYYSEGIHAVLGIRLPTTKVKHELEIGARYHQDEEDRFQEEDGFRMTVGGDMVLTSNGVPGSQANRVSDAEALSLFVQDTISFGRWTVTPGLRAEQIDFSRTDYADAQRTIISGSRSNEVDVLIPGVGARFDVDNKNSFFAGVHRGFSPPGPSAVDTDEEESINYEVGYRRSDGALQLQTTAFFNDYENLLGACTVASGCSSAQVGDLFDGGEVEVRGFEAELTWDIAELGSMPVRLPVNLAATFTETEFLTDFDSDFPAWGNVLAGDELPYVPETQVSLSSGVVGKRFSVFANVTFVDEMRTEAGQGPIPVSESTDAHTLLDLTANYEIRPRVRLFLQGRNLTDKQYVVARRPAGLRPGLDRTLSAGIAVDF